jgi:hypothetical protein
MPKGLHKQGHATAARASAKAIARTSAAETKLGEERRVDMTNQERLMAALFGNPGREHVDIKFLLGGDIDITNEALCGEALKALEQMDASEGDKDFAEAFEQREASDFIASI